jgi:VCBS repeat-containing protein
MDPSKELYQSLAESDEGTLEVDFTATDNSGAPNATSEAKTLTIIITGTNDAPVWSSSSDTEESITESELEGSLNYSLSASLAATDADSGDTLTYGVGTGEATAVSDNVARGSISASDFGDFSVTASGEWTFEAKSPAQQAAINSLAEEETLTLTFPVQVSDGKGGIISETVTVTITGTNDAPMAANDTAEAEEDALALVTGNLADLVSDVDTGDTHTFAVDESVAVTWKGRSVDIDDTDFTLNADGTWTLDTGSALYQSLRQGDAEDLVITYHATDNSGATNATSESKTLTITITGADDLAAISGLTPTLDEPDTVDWWTVTGGQITPTDPDALSARSAVLDLSFSDPDAGDTISVTISRGGESIAFTVDAAGEIQSFVDGKSSLYGDWGCLSYDTGGKQWMYTAFNKADQLNPNEFDTNDPTRDPETGNGLDSFTVTAKGSGSSGTDPDSTQTLTVTVTAQDDGVAVHSAPFTHSQPSQILGPYLNPEAKTDTLDGKLNITDVDDPDSTLVFKVQDPDTNAYVEGTNTGTSEAPTYACTLKYGTLTLKWEAGTADVLDGVSGGVTGNEAGAWVYTYQYTAPKGSVTLNTALTEAVRIQAYDPDVPDAKADLDFDVNVITTSYGEGQPKPVYDVLRYDLANDKAYFGISASPAELGPGNDNLLANDRTIAGADAATYSGGQWNVAPSVAVEAFTMDTEGYGTLTINDDGTFFFAPNLNHPNITALGAGEKLTVSVPYTMTEGGNPFTSYLVIQFDGKNDAPVAENFSLSLTPGWASSSTNEAALNLTDHVSDADAGDALHFEFYDKDGTLLDPKPFGTDSHSFDTGRVQSGKVFDPDGDGINGFSEQVAGQTVLRGEFGWLVQDDSGTWNYVVDKTDPDFIALKKGESLTETIRYKAVDQSGADSDMQTITIRIDGSFHKLAVQTLDGESGRLSGTHFATETDGNGVQHGVWTIGLDPILFI